MNKTRKLKIVGSSFNETVFGAANNLFVLITIINNNNKITIILQYIMNLLFITCKKIIELNEMK